MLLKNIKFCNKFIHYLQSFSFLNKLIMLALQKRHLFKKIKYFFHKHITEWINTQRGQERTEVSKKLSAKENFVWRLKCVNLASLTHFWFAYSKRASERCRHHESALVKWRGYSCATTNYFWDIICHQCDQICQNVANQSKLK